MLRKSSVDDHQIMLRSGALFDLADPKPDRICLDDIAHGLAHICRYVGQCRQFFSVAEHSVLVSHVTPHSKIAALFHDAAEAFIGDMSGPLKQLLPDYKVIEKRIELAICKRFQIEFPMPDEVKLADYSVMAAELELLMPPATNEWLRDTNIVPAKVQIRMLRPAEAKKLFLARYAELTNMEKSDRSHAIDIRMDE